MSIRLRLTLLYSAILALTLIAFSGMVYGIQFRSTLNDQRQSLALMAKRSVEFLERDDYQFDGSPPFPFPPDRDGEPNRRFGIASTYFQYLNLAGEVEFRSENLGEIILPLSSHGAQALEQGESWVEIETVEGERLLIHSEPVVIDGQVNAVQIARSLSNQEQHLSRLRRNLLIGGGVATIAAFGIGWLLSGVVLRPIHRITQTAQTIGAERDLSRRVQYTGPNDAIGRLATTLNGMLTELQAAYQQQQQFVADVSHELRTPLTTLRGNLALLRRQPSISTEDREDILGDMADESDRLIRLVNDLLALARAESGQPLRSDSVCIRPLVEEVCRQAKLLDPERTITCIDLPDVAVVGDQDALKQVLLILMDNALKHTSGALGVSATIANSEDNRSPTDLNVAISIRDSGPGISSEVLTHVFERFYRGEDVHNTSGLGLGLPIAKALIETQNGTIAIESQVHQGSVVTLTLPHAPTQRSRSN